MKNNMVRLLILFGSIAFAILVLNNVPQDEHVTFNQPQKQTCPTEYNYSPTWFKFSDGSWSTLSRHPKTGERGEQITEEEIETLKLADSF